MTSDKKNCWLVNIFFENYFMQKWQKWQKYNTLSHSNLQMWHRITIENSEKHFTQMMQIIIKSYHKFNDLHIYYFVYFPFFKIMKKIWETLNKPISTRNKLTFKKV